MNIELTKGDSKSITVILKSNGVKVPLVNGDVIYFSAKQKLSQTNYSIQKTITAFTNGEAIIGLLPADTNIDTGSYLYDIQLSKASGEVYTILKGKLNITLGVTA